MGPLGDIEVFIQFIQLISNIYKSDKAIINIGIDKIHLKFDCNNGSIVNGVRESILYSFVSSSPPGHKIYKDPRRKLFKKIIKSVLFHITLCLEVDDRQPFDFIKKTISFTCQLIKI